VDTLNLLNNIPKKSFNLRSKRRTKSQKVQKYEKHNYRENIQRDSPKITDG
jgi:hypothetical protein